MKIERLMTFWVKNAAKSESFKRVINESFGDRMEVERGRET